MRTKHIVILSVGLLIILILIMSRDFFYFEGPNQENPYEYDLSSYREVDSSLISYKEIRQLDIDTEQIYAIDTDIADNIYVSVTSKLLIFNASYQLASVIDLDNDAYCIEVKNDRIYLGMTNYVSEFTTEGDFVKNWNEKGSKAIFTSIAANDKNVFIADAGNKIVYAYDHEGNFINDIGGKNPAEDRIGFVVPSPYLDLLIGRDDELWTTNPGIHTLESYRPDGSMISSWRKTSMLIDGFSGCCNPSHIAMLSDGSFVTSEKGLERIKIHLPNGEFNSVVAGPKSFIEGTEDVDIAVDSKDRILITDPKQNKIRIFEMKGR